MLHTIGCLALAALVAIPISTIGFTGVAALLGAGVVLSIIPNGY